MKKFSKFLFLIVAVCLIACVFCACDTPADHEHSFGAWETITEPTCTTKGLKKRTCSCGAEETEEIGKKDHVVVGNICSVCGIKETEGLVFTLLVDGTYKVSGYEGTDTDVVILPTHDGKAVTSIGDWALCERFITSIEIPSSVTIIGKEAFGLCSSLTSIEIPSSVTSIGECAFIGCQLTNIHVAEENANYKSIDGNLYNKNSTTLIQYAIGKTDTSFNIPSSVTSIGKSAFSFCSSLTSIEISNSVTSIGNFAFSYCRSLMSIEIPNSIKSIGEEAFAACYKLVEVYNKSSLKIKKGSSGNGYVGYYAKAVYTQPYESKLSIDENGYIIYTDGDEKSLIGYTGNETELNLPYGISEIYNYAFYNNDKITSITIPSSVTSIGYDAFCACLSLTSIEIPSSVTSIGGYAFSNCYKLVEVYNKSSLNIVAGSEENGCVAYYAKAVYTEPYETKLSTDEKGYIIYTDGDEKSLIGYAGNEIEMNLPYGISEIYNYAFYNNDKITSLTIPSSVTSIGDSAFFYCSSLTSVIIPNSVTSISGPAFCACLSLTSIKFNGTMTQWKVIEKTEYWNEATGDCTVTCTDGVFDKDGNVIG